MMHVIHVHCCSPSTLMPAIYLNYCSPPTLMPVLKTTLIDYIFKQLSTQKYISFNHVIKTLLILIKMVIGQV